MYFLVLYECVIFKIILDSLCLVVLGIREIHKKKNSKKKHLKITHQIFKSVK